MLNHSIRLIIAVCIVVVLFSFVNASYASTVRNDVKKDEPWSIDKADPLDKIDCQKMIKMGIEKQENLRAGRIMVHCGLAPAISRWSPEVSELMESLSKPWAIGGVDVDTITGTTDPYPSVTQAESMVWGNGNTIFATINTSPSATCAGGSYGHGSYSTDGGVTFTRLCPNPFATGHGQNYGDPMGIYNANLGKWYVAFLAVGCGGQGIGVWESTDAINWTTGACAHNGSSDDRESMWVDNNPGSPYYGRMYLAWNDFATANGDLKLTYSDNGTTWTGVTIYNGSAFHRDVQVTGSPGTDGTVFVASMDEGNGGSDNRINLMYRSTDGGATWTLVYTSSSFPPPGSALCPSNPYFYMIVPIWRHMGWGQPAVGPANTIHYVYAGGAAGDYGNIYYIRSTDNGTTWSAPIQLNQDTTTNAQWMPSLVATGSGQVLASWYDRRNTTDGTNYQRYGRISNNAGVSWQDDDVISDVISPQPLQPDSSIVDCYAGDYDYGSTNGTKALVSWTDGRTLISGNSQQDVYFDQVQLCDTVPNAPTGTTATATAPNQITVTWNAVSGANCYNVYKSNGTCPGSTFQRISSCVAATTYADNDVSGGSTYSYKVTSVITPSNCESVFSPCADATATGICTLNPTFAGVTAAVDNYTSNCSVTVEWAAGTSQCSSFPTLTYTIYKSNDPSFVPGSANQVATCVSGTTWLDTNVASGLTFYYVVRAEDSRSGGVGPCNGGNFETNIIKANVSPLGPGAVLFSDDFEAGISNWTISANWQWVTTQSHSGTHSAWSNDLTSQVCDSLTQTTAVTLPASPAYKLGFWTYFNLETGYDNGIVYGSSNGTVFSKLSLTPNYPGSSNAYAQACLGTNPQPSFSGAYTTWTQYTSDLTSYGGGNFQARFTVGTDSSVSHGGWWIDDVRINGDIFCQNGNPNCTTSPQFNGLATAIGAGTSSCQIDLTWSAGTSTCTSGPNVTYHIYRSTDPAFIPSASNRIADCVTGTTYSDTHVYSNTKYYYIVRAEDSTTNGSGPCNNGNSDINLIRKNEVGGAITAFRDDFETGIGNWTVSLNWQSTTSRAHSGTHSAWSNNITYQNCDTLTQTASVALPSGIKRPALHFWTYFYLEDGYDDGVVYGSSNGTSFNKLTLTPDYPGTIGGANACIGTGSSFTGDGTTWTQYDSDLSSYKGGNFAVRFTQETDVSGNYGGWYIDDVSIDYRTACSTPCYGLFTDVSSSNPFCAYIEKIRTLGIAAGCTTTTYCPTAYTQRQAMAKFVCLSMNVSSPASCSTEACAGIFADVPSSNPFCTYIEGIYNEGLVNGCSTSPLNYCPNGLTQRQAMAKFMCLGMEAANPGSCPTAACAGTFGDVTAANPFCTYIEGLFNAGVVNGCSSSPLLYCPTNNVTREQMSKFLVNGFSI